MGVGQTVTLRNGDIVTLHDGDTVNFSYAMGIYSVIPKTKENTWTTSIQKKPISKEHDFCIFQQDSIAPGSSYGECATCKSCFSFDDLKKCFAYKNTKCPVCRCEWTQWIQFMNEG
jgi:hypothetical protein